MIILDTNVVSELMAERPNPAVIGYLDHTEEEILLNAISVAEIRYGLALLPNGNRKRRLTDAFDLLLSELGDNRVLDFSNAATGHYANICASARRAGKTVSMADAMIAAICVLHAAPLISRNIRDFKHTGIELINPWES